MSRPIRLPVLTVAPDFESAEQVRDNGGALEEQVVAEEGAARARAQGKGEEEDDARPASWLLALRNIGESTGHIPPLLSI